MKKWTLKQHIDDIKDWNQSVGDYYSRPLPEDQIFFVAYERWLNDRDLLSVEDGFTFTGWHSGNRSPAREANPQL